MVEKIRASRYNHFVPLHNGNRLAFNALTCGLAEMDPDSYQRYCDLIARGETNGDSQDDLIANLRKGGFIAPADLDEMDAIRAGHYQARFGQHGFGLTIIPTYQCNFACEYCYEDRDLLRSSPSRGMMTAETCRRVVRLCEQSLTGQGNFGVAWFGGEPLLALKTVEELSQSFISLCNSKQVTYGASMITNGYLLIPKVMDALLRCRIGFVQITLDGPKSIHDSRRPLRGGKGTYRRIMSNLAEAVEHADVTFSLRVNIDRTNSEAIGELFCDLKALGLTGRKNLSLYFGHTLPYARSCGGVSGHCMEAEEFARWTGSAYQSAMDEGVDVSVFPKRNYSACSAVGTRSFVVEPNGNVSPCWVTLGDPAHKIGELTDDGIQFTSTYVRWLGYDAFRRDCVECDILPLCMGGCPYRSLNKSGIDSAAGGVCSPWRYDLLTYLKTSRSAALRKRDHLKGEGGDTQQQSTLDRSA